MIKKLVIVIITIVVILASIVGHYVANISFADEGITEVNITEEYDYKNPFIMPEFKYGWFYDKVKNIKLPYRYTLPVDYDESKKYPIIMFYHGNGSIGVDNNSHVWGITRAFPIAGDIMGEAIVVLPQTPTVWDTNGSTGILDVTVRLADMLVERYNGDKNRIYVTGLSLGGFATWDVVAAYPNYFAAAVPVCGGVYARNTESFLQIPIWTYHGSADSVVSFLSTKGTYNAVIAAGGEKIKFIQLNGVDHNAWDYAYTDREMLSWLFSQELGGQQDLTYTYRNYFEIVSPSGKVLVTEDDITDYYVDDDGILNYKLSDEAVEGLKKQYILNPNGVLSIRFGSQKLYDFKIATFSKENVFKLEQTVDDSSYSAISNVFTQDTFETAIREGKYTVYSGE